MREIPLTQGQVALVDDGDYPALSKHKWRAIWNKESQSYYAVRSLRRVGGHRPIVRMHREIMRPDSHLEVDHINHNGLDNRRCNLRVCTHRENSANHRKKRQQASSIYKGAYWNQRDQVWRAQIRWNGEVRHLGTFGSEVEAALAYNQAASEHFGEFAYTNNVSTTVGVAQS